MFDQHRLQPLAPDIELLDRGRTKSVARNKEDLLAGVAVLRSEFADGGGFTDTIDAEKQDDPGFDGERLRAWAPVSSPEACSRERLVNVTTFPARHLRFQWAIDASRVTMNF